ncbi:hypothetical protein [Streptomyces indicus]|uniref:Membrane lipoprotein n=1 Tax=Streptomyces indicus TaxID=417292 RepID=A0A1G8V682_9ACTN|nr:hypothetical protein [Streptomyces indicus]SDJ61364.1 hypothetical protein SAMN05421806_1011270 [Streptomyces indicus]
MNRLARYAPAALLPLLLTACGTESAGSGGPAPDRAALEARAQAAQIDIAKVYVTEAEGFELASQSVGVVGADGFQATYIRKDTPAAQLTLSVDAGTMDAASCPGPESARCERDGEHWYRSTDAGHAYVLPVDGVLVRLSADRSAVDRETLREAAEKAHRASDAELDAVLPESSGGTGGVERGDLPAEGDGAPQDPPGAGG